MIENKENTSFEMREMKAELGLLSKSDGSAMFSQGNIAVKQSFLLHTKAVFNIFKIQGITTLLVNINGPVEVKIQNMNVEKASIEVYYRPKSGLPSVDDRFKEKFVQQCMETALYSELHPRTAYRIQLQEIENRGGVLACAINTTCLALLNTGLEQKFLVAAVYCVVNEDGEITVDPDLRTYHKPTAVLTFVFDSLQIKALAVHTAGKFTMEQYQKAMDLCRSASEKVFDFYRDIVKKVSVIL